MGHACLFAGVPDCLSALPQKQAAAPSSLTPAPPLDRAALELSLKQSIFESSEFRELQKKADKLDELRARVPDEAAKHTHVEDHADEGEMHDCALTISLM